MGDNGTANGIGPVFDFSEFSWQDSKRTDVLQLRARQLTARLVRPETLLDEAVFEATQAKLDEITAEFERIIAKILVSVPREWLVRGAPEDIDWHDPASLNWVRGNKFQELQKAMGNASNPEQVTGN